jgi:hyperosmotically inducible periplasmic protein
MGYEQNYLLRRRNINQMNFNYNTKRVFRIGAALVALVAVTLPLYADVPAGKTQGSSASQPATLKMAETIRKSLVTLPNYGVFDDLSFSIRGSEVTLNGYASRPTLKTSAERVVMSTPGVESVVNNIEVLPVSQFDDQIRFRAYLAIYRNPNLRQYSSGGPLLGIRSPAWLAGGITNNPPIGWNPIHIIVKNGNVTLTGVVDRAMDKQIIGMVTNQIPGVFSVDNDLLVANGKPAASKDAAS